MNIKDQLRSSRSYSGFAVKDITAAAKFYEGTLGLKVSREKMGLIRLHLAGLSGYAGTDVLVYPKPDHTAAAYTILNFPVPDIQFAVDELTKANVKFEQYEGMIKTDAKGISRHDGMAIAWFKDPSGNILSLIEDPTSAR